MWTRFSVLTALEGENGLECWRISVRYSGLGETGLNVVSTSPTLLPSLSLSFSFVPRSPLSAFVLFSIVVPCPCFPTPLSRPEIDCSRFVAWQHVERENCADQAALLPHYLYRRGDGSRQTYAECVCVCVHRFNVLVTLSPYRAVECRDCPYTLLWMIQLRTTLYFRRYIPSSFSAYFPPWEVNNALSTTWVINAFNVVVVHMIVFCLTYRAGS